MKLARTPRLLAVFALVAGLAAPAAAITELRVSPLLPSASELVTATFTVAVGCNEPTFAAPEVTPGSVRIVGTYPGGEDCPTSADRTFTLPLGQLPAGEYWLQVELQFQNGFSATGAYALHVEPSRERLLLDVGGQRFDVEVTWTNQHHGTTGKGRPVRLGELSGYFWFFDPQLSEVTVKILDGRPLNSRFWIFLGSMTDVGVTVTVRRLTGSYCQDTGTCETRRYELAPGTIEGVVDFAAF